MSTLAALPRMRPKGFLVGVGAAALAGVFAPGEAGAQSSVSAQGFGYPLGQLSSRAIGLGGSTAELDPVTTRNPAALSAWGRSGLHLQYDPEFRRVVAFGGEDRTLAARFPLIAGAMQISRTLTAGLSISTLLDRTYTTRSAQTQIVNGEELHSLTLFSSAGGLNDVRLGLAYMASPRLRFGVGGHVVTGENRVRVSTVFDREGYVPLERESEVSYNGTALSAGVTWQPGLDLALGLSGRLEGSLRASRAGTSLRTGRLPSRAGLSIAYTGIAGAVLSAGTDFEQWSAIEGLGSEDVRAQDTQEYGLGAEVEGPRVKGSVVALRGGFRWRSLPFGVPSTAFDGAPGVGDGMLWARERSYSIGVGIPLANVGGLHRAGLDIAAQRATRSGFGEVAERAWTLSVGLAVRP